MASELHPDQKGNASLTLGQVILDTRSNFPDSRYRPEPTYSQGHYHLFGINPGAHRVMLSADGVGTKPELAERMVTSKLDPEYITFAHRAHDTFAMVESDIARWGFSTLGVANIIDMNKATPEAVNALATGAKAACDSGRFALLNGEIAELQHRSSGYGDERFNWNAVGLALMNEKKFLDPMNLESGDFLVAVREQGIRSNGLSLARRILETDYLNKQGVTDKTDYFRFKLEQFLAEQGFHGDHMQRLRRSTLVPFMDGLMGHPFLEQMLLPWHELHPETVNDLLIPSTLYSPVMFDAQGGVDGPRPLNMIAAAHISGGGIPEKIKRMVEPKGLGAEINTVFPEPNAVRSLMEIGKNYVDENGDPLVTERKASQNWGRGNGFVVAVRSYEDVSAFIDIANDTGREAELAGQVIPQREIHFKNEVWTY